MEIQRKISRIFMNLHLGNIDSRNLSFSDLLEWRFKTGIDVLFSPYLSPQCKLAYEAGLASKKHQVCRPPQRHLTVFRQSHGAHTTFWRPVKVSPRPRRAQSRRRRHWPASSESLRRELLFLSGAANHARAGIIRLPSAVPNN
jgi:hypothetical protein